MNFRAFSSSFERQNFLKQLNDTNDKLEKNADSDFGEFEFELKLVIATKDGVGSPPGLVNRFSDSIDVHYSFRFFFL